jgi:hypothetical protein
MTTDEQLGYTKRLNEILCSRPSEQRDRRLANFMTDLEGAYQIPLVGKDRIEDFEVRNPKVMQLYRIASKARTLF